MMSSKTYVVHAQLPIAMQLYLLRKQEHLGCKKIEAKLEAPCSIVNVQLHMQNETCVLRQRPSLGPCRFNYPCYLKPKSPNKISCIAIWSMIRFMIQLASYLNLICNRKNYHKNDQLVTWPPFSLATIHKLSKRQPSDC